MIDDVVPASDELRLTAAAYSIPGAGIGISGIVGGLLLLRSNVSHSGCMCRSCRDSMHNLIELIEETALRTDALLTVVNHHVTGEPLRLVDPEEGAGQ